MNGVIAIFAYQRHKFLEEIFTEIRNSKLASELPMKIFIDGAKTQTSENNEKILSIVRDLTSKKDEVILRSRNIGLRQNVTLGLDTCSENFLYFIAIEDDTVVTAAGLDSMVTFLERPDSHPTQFGALNSASFINTHKRKWLKTDRMISWGWGTTANVWRSFREEQPAKIPQLELLSRIPKTYCYPERLFVKWMYRQVAELDSWAIDFGHWLRTQEKTILSPPVNYLELRFGDDYTHTAWGPWLPPTQRKIAMEESSDSSFLRLRFLSWVRFLRTVLGFLRHKFG